MEEIVIIAAKRTPFGAFGGSLKNHSSTDLGVIASLAAIKQAGIEPSQIDHVVIGNVIQSTADAIYAPRHIGLKCGVPENVAALGLNRLCGSGFQAIATAAQMILTGEATCVLAGGTESMSLVPYIVRQARFGYRMGPGEFEDYLTAALVDPYAGAPMAITAENLAEKYHITRAEVDAYSYQSQQRCKQAVLKNLFEDELTSVELKDKKGNITHFKNDEHPRPDTTLEILAKLKPVFKKDGVVTAGGSSGITDGAASLIVTTKSLAIKKGLKPLAKLIAFASVGCDPKIMGIGPAQASRKALEKAGLKLSDMGLVEVNEAFAAQYLAVEKELGLNREITNVNGGAIAIGHPLAASGARITAHLIYELKRRQLKFALGSACIGGGQGIALILENLS